MTFDELASLQHGDKVKWIVEGDEDLGTVEESAPINFEGEILGSSYIGIKWDHYRRGQVSPITYRDVADKIARP